MSWTKVSKPTGTPYTNVNTQGKEQYDQADIMFDDIIPYDGINTVAWTSVSKPTGGRFVFPGMATGLLMPPTYSRGFDVGPWIKITKPTD